MTLEDRKTFDRIRVALQDLYSSLACYDHPSKRAEVASLLRILQGCPTPGCLNLARDCGPDAPYCRECAEKLREHVQ